MEAGFKVRVRVTVRSMLRVRVMVMVMVRVMVRDRVCLHQPEKIEAWTRLDSFVTVKRNEKKNEVRCEVANTKRKKRIKRIKKNKIE